MAKLVAISGTHGSGKSTLINQLASVKYYAPTLLGCYPSQSSIYIDNFKVARSVQAQFGMTVAEAWKDPKTLMEFQEAVFFQKLKHDEQLKARTEDYVIVERSFLDIMVYAKLGLSFNSHISSEMLEIWIEDYQFRCMHSQTIYDGIVFVPAHPDIPFKSEDNRASEETRHYFETNFKKCFIHTMSFKRQLIPFTIIKNSAIDQRVEQALNFIQTL